jgi:hypothetical protein
MLHTLASVVAQAWASSHSFNKGMGAGAGVSLGAMHAWLAAAADTRVAAVAPLIGIQGFRWAVENNAFHARVASIPKVRLP